MTVSHLLFSALLWKQWVSRHCLNLIKLKEETDDALGRQTVKWVPNIGTKTQYKGKQKQMWKRKQDILGTYKLLGIKTKKSSFSFSLELDFLSVAWIHLEFLATFYSIFN